MKKKVLIIDSEKREIYESSISSLEDMQQIVGGCITTGHRFPNGDELYVNDEGMLNPENFFIVRGAHQPFAGNGFVIGNADEDGESQDVEMSVAQLKSLVKFVDANTIALAYSPRRVTLKFLREE